MTDPRLARAAIEIQNYYGQRLVGAVLFGSRATPRSRADSDWDVLIVLTDDEPIRRSLYREWDERLAPRVEALLPGISPHFVHVPAGEDGPSSLWLEVAMTHEILSDPTGQLSACLRRIRSLIDAGRFEQRAAHGLAYWRSAR